MTLLGNQTLVWQNNGEFEDKIHVLIRLDEEGTFHVLESLVDEIEITELSKLNKTQSIHGAKEDIVSIASASDTQPTHRP